MKLDWPLVSPFFGAFIFNNRNSLLLWPVTRVHQINRTQIFDPPQENAHVHLWWTDRCGRLNSCTLLIEKGNKVKSIIIGGGRVPGIKGWKGVSSISLTRWIFGIVISWNWLWFVKLILWDQYIVKKKLYRFQIIVTCWFRELSTNPVRTLRSITILLSTNPRYILIGACYSCCLLSDSHLCFSLLICDGRMRNSNTKKGVNWSSAADALHDTIICQSHLNNLITFEFNVVLIRLAI